MEKLLVFHTPMSISETPIFPAFAVANFEGVIPYSSGGGQGGGGGTRSGVHAPRRHRRSNSQTRPPTEAAKKMAPAVCWSPSCLSGGSKRATITCVAKHLGGCKATKRHAKQVKSKLGHCAPRIRTLASELGQHPPVNRTTSGTGTNGARRTVRVWAREHP
jgi:hypothetical protein